MKQMNFKYQQILFYFLVCCLCFQTCTDESPVIPETNNRGDVSEVTNMGTISRNEIKQMFAISNTEIPFSLNYSVKTLSVNYYSIDANDELVIVSGALYIPQDSDNLPLISLQHGTQSKRDLVASVSPTNSVEGTIGLLMASIGYLTLIPDYIGFGVSNIIHPYLHAESLVPSVIDLLRAGKTYCEEHQITLDGRLFLTGYSEGGYTSLLTQKAIEENYFEEFNLTAVAPLAGPYDLKGTVDMAFQNNNYEGDMAYIGYFFTAYNEIYGWNRLNDIFNAPYSSKMLDLYNGSKTWGEILAQLPDSFSDLMNPDFLTNYLNGSETEVINAIQENTILDWKPQTPIHFFHGDADVTVPFENVLAAKSKFESYGATKIQLTAISNGNHATTGPAASIGAIQWFESFL